MNIIPQHTDIASYEFFRKLTGLPFVEAIYLYGSRARGDAISDNADIDLAIACPEATDAQWHQLLDIMEKADTLLKIDCVRLERITDRTFREEIERDKVALWTR